MSPVRELLVTLPAVLGSAVAGVSRASRFDGRKIPNAPMMTTRNSVLPDQARMLSFMTAFWRRGGAWGRAECTLGAQGAGPLGPEGALKAFCRIIGSAGVSN